MKTIKKIWNDPVGSKIITAILIGIGSIIWTSNNSLLTDIEFFTAFRNFWTYNIELWVIVSGLLVLIVLFQLMKSRNKQFKYDEDTLKLDRNLFSKIRELLPQDRTIYFLRHNNFAGFSFNLEDIDDIYNFESENVKSDFEFLNPELEKLKKELLRPISHFTRLIGFETFPTRTGRQTVPEEWEIEQPERFNRVVEDLHKTKHEICTNYDELIRKGIRILKI